MSIRKMLSGLAAVVFAVPLLAFGAPPVLMVMPAATTITGGVLPLAVCLTSNQVGMVGQSVSVVTTGGALSRSTVVTGANGCASDRLSGLRPYLTQARLPSVTATWRVTTTSTLDINNFFTVTPEPQPVPTPKITVPPEGTVHPKPKTPTPQKPTPKGTTIAPAPRPTITVLAPAQRQVGQPIPATITLLRGGRPDAHAIVALGTTRGHLSQTTGTTNRLGQIHITVTRAPVGRVTITAHTGTIQGRATVRVLAHPFPWWALLALIGLLAWLLLIVATLRRRRRRGGTGHVDPEQTL